MTRIAILLLAKFLLIAAAVGQSQRVLLYATFAPQYLSGVSTGDSFSNQVITDQTGSFWARGVGAGVTWNFLETNAIALGLDLRGSTRPGTPGADTVLAGVKLTGCAACRLTPYAQVSGGYLGTRAHDTSSLSGAGGSTDRTQYVTFEFLGGLDCPIGSHVGLRLLELGIGRGSEFAIFVANPGHSTVFSLNSGIVFHF